MKVILIGGAALSLLTVSAFGADLGTRFNPPAPPPFTWTGCYAGGHADGGFGQQDLADTAGALAPTTGFTSANLRTTGYMLGGQVGCDYQFGANWVLGIEGAASGGNIGGRATAAQTVPGGGPGDNATFKDTTDFLASVTARSGYAWDRWLLYAKGGVALADNRYSVPGVFAGLPYDFDGSETRLGWTAGAGIEWALWNDWSVKLEYDYYGFGTRNVTFIEETTNQTGPEEIKQNIQVILLGLNFRPTVGP